LGNSRDVRIRAKLVDREGAASTTKFERVAVTHHRARAVRNDGTADTEVRTTVTLASVLDTKVLVAIAEGCTVLKGHVLAIGVRSSGESAATGRFIVAPGVVVVADDFGVGRGFGLNKRAVRVKLQAVGLTTVLGSVARARCRTTKIQNFLGVGTDCVVTPTLATVFHTSNRITSIGASGSTHLDSVGLGVVEHVGQSTRARIGIAAYIGHVVGVHTGIG
jgi:bacterioferritin-associated ferredoxin